MLRSRPRRRSRRQRRVALCACGHPHARHELIDHDDGRSPGDIEIREKLGLSRYSTVCSGMPAADGTWPSFCTCSDFVADRPVLELVRDA